MHVRVCVECDEEYRPEVAVCADCGGALQDRHEGEDEEGSEDPGPDMGPEAHSDEPLPLAHAIATANYARELVPLADGLLEAGIEFRIAAREAAGEDRARGYELQVRDADRDAAVRAVVDRVDPDSGVTLLVVWAPPPTDETEGELVCPACASPLVGTAAECPACGLGL